jgi:hypothetical protein
MTTQTRASRITGHIGSPSRKSNHSPHVRVRCCVVLRRSLDSHTDDAVQVRPPLINWRGRWHSLESQYWRHPRLRLHSNATSHPPAGSGSASWTVDIGPRRGPGWSPVAEAGRGGPVPSIDRPIGTWRRSTACSGGECVEVRYWRGRVLVRSSKVPDVMLRFSWAEWQAFMTYVATAPSPPRTEQG